MKRRSVLTFPFVLALQRFLPFKLAVLEAQTTPNFHLQATSPAIRAGVFIAEVTTDFDGKPRPNPPCCGAYEYVATMPPQTVPAPTNVLVR